MTAVYRLVGWLLALGMLSVPQLGEAQADILVGLAGRRVSPRDIGRVVDRNFAFVGVRRVGRARTRTPNDLLRIESSRDMSRRALGASLGAYRRSQWARMQQAQARGFVRATRVTEVHALDLEAGFDTPSDPRARYYVHAVHVGRAYHRQFFGPSAAVGAAVDAALAGRAPDAAADVGMTDVGIGFRMRRRGDDSSLFVLADEARPSAALHERGRPRPILVVFRPIRTIANQSARATTPRRPNMSGVTRCAGGLLARDPQARAEVSVEIVYERSGAAIGARVRSRDNPRFARCVQRALRSWFRDPARRTTIVRPFVLRLGPSGVQMRGTDEAGSGDAGE